MDAGLSTEANLAWLRARGYPWITVQRGRAPRPDSAPDAAFATRAGHPVQAWRVDSEGDETHLRVWSQQRQQKDWSGDDFVDSGDCVIGRGVFD